MGFRLARRSEGEDRGQPGKFSIRSPACAPTKCSTIPPRTCWHSLPSPPSPSSLTDKAGKQVTVRISKAYGDFAYVQASNSPALYKVKKQIVDDLNLSAADAALVSRVRCKRLRGFLKQLDANRRPPARWAR